jgi:hypothetical protein
MDEVMTAMDEEWKVTMREIKEGKRPAKDII